MGETVLLATSLTLAKRRSPRPPRLGDDHETNRRCKVIETKARFDGPRREPHT
jgi:hypothetical protein